MNLPQIIKKYLPNFVVPPLAQLCREWNARTVLNKEMIWNLTEFYNKSSADNESKITYKETVALCKVSSKVNADLWNVLNPKTEKEIKDFYEVTPYYPFELAYWHMKRWQKKLREEVVKLSSGNVLDYGGGIGDLCIELAKTGLNVSYGDVQGKNWEFAKWLFEKKGYNIKIIDLGNGLIPKNMMFDTIISIDVIEHVPNPEVVLEDIAMHLKNNGNLIITALDCPGKTENNPMHLTMKFDAEECLNSLKIFKTDLDWLWTKRI